MYDVRCFVPCGGCRCFRVPLISHVEDSAPCERPFAPDYVPGTGMHGADLDYTGISMIRTQEPQRMLRNGLHLYDTQLKIELIG